MRVSCRRSLRMKDSPPSAPVPHRQVDDDDVGLLRAIEAEAVGEGLRLDDLVDAGIFEQLPAALQHDRVIVDDQHTGHDSPRTSSGVRRRATARSTGISTWTVVPWARELSITQLPPSERTRSDMAVRPKPLGVAGAIPLPSSLRMSASVARGFLAPDAGTLASRRDRW